MTKMNDQKARNRALFPTAAGFVDEMRSVFGPGVVLEWAEENGQTIGKRGPDGVQPVIDKKENEDLEMDKQKNGGRRG